MREGQESMDAAAPAWRVGENVPWSAAWSGEQSFRLQHSRDFPGMVEVDQIDRPGVGEPLFAAIHVSRHRRAMVDQLCHVCGKPTLKRDRYMFPIASGDLVTMHDGSQQYGCNVPPLHLACARRAARQCPHLGKLYDQPVPCPPSGGRLIHRTDVVPGMEGLAATIAPGQEVVFTCYRLFDPDFTRRVIRLRREWDQAQRARLARARSGSGG
jgi:hypothetical protein